MKTLFKACALPLVLLISVQLISWRFFEPLNDDKIADPGPNSSSGISDPESLPAARDVFVQRIRGDREHLLVIASYLKEDMEDENISIVYNGQTLIFRDDGKEMDKIKGDGNYTAIVNADVSEFRRNALVALNQRHTIAGSRSTYKFVGREIVPDDIAGIQNNFDIRAFDNEQVTTVSALGNALVENDSIKTHSLTVTSLSVVEDPARTWNPCTQQGTIDGPWTFKTLMKNLASTDPSNLADDAKTSAFVLNWLNQWATNQVINKDTAKARQKVLSDIISPWLDKSFESGAPDGQLDMRFAPFKLTAIINRLDLRGRRDAGEGRFVFCLINKNCNDKEKFNVIFEYGVPRSGCSQVLDYAQQWFNLKDLVLGSSEYNQALENITNGFSKCGTSPTKPNQSSLNQLRTNEVSISNLPLIWELREFRLDGNSHLLAETTIQKEPAEKYNVKVDNPNVERMVRFINANLKPIKRNKYTIPETFEDSAFLGAVGHVDNPPAGDLVPNIPHWDGAGRKTPLAFIQSVAVRHSFSLNACSGCHGGETQTGFTHIDPAFFGTEATLSGFLTGKAGSGGSFDFDNDANNGVLTVKDAANRPPKSPALRPFNDLERRKTDLTTLVSAPCGSLLQLRNALMFEPLNMTH